MGSVHNIKTEKYSSHLKEYKFEAEKYKLSWKLSYNLTLPFRPKTSNKRFIENHQNFGNMIQWIEPLLLSSFFSDPVNVSLVKEARGSMRVLVTDGY